MAERYQFGDCLFDASALELWRRGQRVEARPRVLMLLAHLLRNPDRLVPKEELAQVLWPGLFVGDGSLTQLVYELRRLLGEPQGTETWVRTVRGRGYRFSGVIERIGTRSSASVAPFVGRLAEIEQLERALEAALRGSGRSVLVYGEPGIGKTTLALQLAERASARSADVQIARAGDGVDAPAFWPWTQLLRGLLRSRGVQEFRAAADRGLSDIARIMPELAGGTPSGGDRFGLLDAVSRLVLGCARRRPLVAIFEDVHAFDEASLRLLVMLMEQAPDAPLLVLGTFRDGELARTHPLTDALVQLRRTPGFESVGLRALADEEMAQLVVAVVGARPPRAFIDRACRLAEGNPFFALELVRHWIEHDVVDRTQSDWTNSGALAALGLPRSVHDVLRQRLESLSPACADVLRLAAVLGRAFERSVLERAAGIAPAQVATALDEAYVAGIIRELPRSAGRQEFTHALLRESLYWELPPQQRRQLHRAAGDALETLQLAQSDEHLAALSHHFFQCAGPGELERPIRYGTQAAARACANLAFEEGARQYRRVLDMVALTRDFPTDDELDLHLALADALERAGRADQARAERQAAAGLARRARRPELLARAALSAASDPLPRLVGGPPTAEVELLEEALANLPATAHADTARVEAQLSILLCGSDRGAEALRLGQRAVELCARLEDPALTARAHYAACLARMRPSLGGSDPDEPASVAALADAAAQPELAFCARVLEARALLEIGEIDRAEGLAAEIARRAARLRTPRARGWSLLLRASLSGLRGELGQVDGLLRAAGEEAERAADPRAAIDVQLLGVVLHHLYGARPERGVALRELQESITRVAPARPLVWLSWFEERNPGGASREALAREIARTTDDLWSLARSCSLAHSCLELGDRAGAQTLYERLLPHAARNAVAGLSFAVLTPVSLSLARLASCLGLEADAERHFDAAIGQCEQRRMPAHRIQAQLDCAAHLLDASSPPDPGKLAELIDGALASARSLGAPALVSRALAARSALERSKS
jgi:DNA-binding winged helix-turn-helix (wHTH) protein